MLLGLVFRLIRFWEEISDRYRFRYYHFKYYGKIFFENSIVLFGKGTYIYFVSIEQKAKLFIGDFAIFRRNCNLTLDFNGNIKIGRHCFFNNNCSINSLGNICIGDYTLFGENVKIYDHNHVYSDNSIPISKQGFAIGSVSIGNNCWIGSNCIILNNVVIGDNVIIGANNLIHKSIPSNTIVKANIDYTTRGR